MVQVSIVAYVVIGEVLLVRPRGTHVEPGTVAFAGVRKSECFCPRVLQLLGFDESYRHED